ncbi:MAG: sulfatase-like hydrolase/transferase, partial [Burkholderiaceae bacterium]|nr:sulfatase-like hydrolase/transferase [Burkholderiaceae bacterium]
MDLPPPDAPFNGVIADTIAQSTPDWPRRARPPQGAPNVVVIVLDDLGFGHLSCYGGPIAAPNIAALAANGLRYNNFHTTALCSPTRAALLTGRNHHSVGFAAIAEMASGFPGANSYLPRSAVSVAEVLRQSGYSTFC